MSSTPNPLQPALRVVVVDDEPLARLRLAALLRELGSAACAPEDGSPTPARVELVGEAASGEALLALLAATPCDLVLLDIQMPGALGTEVAARLRRLPRPPAIVFVTAHGEHALQAFELDAVDYLTKPVRRERLAQALQRAAQRLAPPAPAAPQAAPIRHDSPESSRAFEAQAAAVQATGVAPALVVTERGRVLRVPLSEVLYLKAELKYITVRTASHRFLLEDSLTELEPRLGPRFLRIHRNALVAAAAVRALERRAAPPTPAGAGSTADADGWSVRIAPVDEWLAVSRRQLSAVRAVIEKGVA